MTMHSLYFGVLYYFVSIQTEHVNSWARMPANRSKDNQKACRMCFDHCCDLFREFISSIQVNIMKICTRSQNVVCSVEITHRNWAQLWVECLMHTNDITLEIIRYHGDVCDFHQVIVSIMVIGENHHNICNIILIIKSTIPQLITQLLNMHVQVWIKLFKKR